METRDGRPAEIVRWDFKARGVAYPAILARVKFDNYERVFICTEAGISRGIADDYDLFLVPVEQDAYTITGWVARNDKDGMLYWYSDKPTRGDGFWNSIDEQVFDVQLLYLPDAAFPSLHWEDEPIEVTLTIKRKEESK